MVRKGMILFAATALLATSCNTYTGAGAYGGATIGAMLGSAIGGIAGGPRGDDIGTLIGMAGGAIVGAAAGAQADKQQQENTGWYHSNKTEESYRQRMQQRSDEQPCDEAYYQRQGTSRSISANTLADVDSGFDPSGSGDDRLYDFQGSDYTTNYSAAKATTTLPTSSSVDQLAAGLAFMPSVEIRNARFVDDNRDNAINRGELCKMIFEVYNHGQQPLRDIEPKVVESTGNKHLTVSPGLHVEELAPGRGIRYTALIKADKRLKDGNAKICVSVVQGGKTISSVQEFNVATKK